MAAASANSSSSKPSLDVYTSLIVRAARVRACSCSLRQSHRNAACSRVTARRKAWAGGSNVVARCWVASKCSRAIGTKLSGGNRNDAAACGEGILMGLRPGGRDGVRLASVGIGGNASAGGGDVGDEYGLVIYDASDAIDGMGSRKPLLLDIRRRVPLPPLPFPGDALDGRPVWPLFCFGERLLEGGLPDELDHLLVPLTGGWLWNKQKM